MVITKEIVGAKVITTMAIKGKVILLGETKEIITSKEIIIWIIIIIIVKIKEILKENIGLLMMNKSKNPLINKQTRVLKTVMNGLMNSVKIIRKLQKTQNKFLKHPKTKMPKVKMISLLIWLQKALVRAISLIEYKKVNNRVTKIWKKKDCLTTGALQ